MDSCAEAKVAHLVRASGRQESEHLLGMVVGQYRRLLSTTAVRAQAMCLLARVGLVTPASKEGAGYEDGGGAEEGEESAIDGVVGGPRVGKERQLPPDVLKIVPI